MKQESIASTKPCFIIVNSTRIQIVKNIDILYETMKETRHIFIANVESC